MSIREMKHTQRALWTLIVFALLAVEIRSITAARERHDKDQIEDRKRIDSDFEAVLRQNQQAFEATVSRLESVVSGVKAVAATTENTLASITGGDSFCYFAAVPNVWTGSPRQYSFAPEESSLITNELWHGIMLGDPIPPPP